MDGREIGEREQVGEVGVRRSIGKLGKAAVVDGDRDIGRGRERIRRLLASLVMGYHAPDARPLRW